MASGVKGVKLSAVTFTPEDIPGRAENVKFKSEKCQGIRIKITDRGSFNSVRLGLAIITAAQKLYPSQFLIKNRIDKLFGDFYLRQMVLNGASARMVELRALRESRKFLEQRQKYLLY